MSFNAKTFRKSISTSRVSNGSLIGEKNEIIPINEWDLGELSPLRNACKEHFYHPHPIKMFEYILEHHEMTKDTVLFTNCNAKKPYSTSATFKNIIRGTHPFENIYDLVIISSIGVIPIKYEKYYPFAHYAWDDNHHTSIEIRTEFIKVNSERIMRFLEKFPYKNIIAVFRVTSKGKEALLTATKRLDKSVIEIPSKIAFENMGGNVIKINVFQLTNNDTLSELNSVLKDISEGRQVIKRESPTPEEVKLITGKTMRVRREERKKLKEKGFTEEEIYDFMYNRSK